MTAAEHASMVKLRDDALRRGMRETAIAYSYSIIRGAAEWLNEQLKRDGVIES